MSWQILYSNGSVFLLILWMLSGCTDAQNQADKSSLGPQHTASGSPAMSLVAKSHQALEQGAVLTALALADSAKRLAPELADVYFARGRILSALKRFDSADSSYKRTLSLAPNYRGAWYSLGNNALRQGQPSKAISRFHQSSKTHPTPATFVHMGHAYAKLNKVDSAQKAYRQALEIDSSYAPASIMMGQLYKERGALARALEYTQRAWRLEPKNTGYRYELGSLLLQIGKAEEAISHLKTVVKEQPWHAKAHYKLGRAFMYLGQPEAGQRYLGRSDSLGTVQAHIERLRRLALDKPNAVGRWIELGHVLRQAGRLDDATEAYNVALSLAPENLALRKNIANLAAMRGSPKEAIYRYHAILRRDSSATDVWLNLGIAYTRIGSMKAAQQAWKNVLKYEPNHPKASAYLARLQSTR